MDFIIWLIVALSLLAGCWLQTALGFGMAVLAAPVIVMVRPEWVPVILTVVALSLSILNAWNQRSSLQVRQLVVPFITRLPGTAMGAWLLLQLTSAWLQIAVAICVLGAVIVSYYGKQFQYTPTRLGLAGFVSGVTGTTTSVGGPPMALVMQHGAPATVRANLSLYFAYSCIVSLISYEWTGILTTELWEISFSLLPVSFLGFYLGKRARGYVDAGRFRPLLLIVCSAAGLVALGGAIYRL